MDPWTLLVNALRGGLFALAHVWGGNLGWAIISLSVALRLALLPLTLRLARRALRTHAAIQRLQPELKRVQARYRDEPEALARETMALYRRHGVSVVDGKALLGGFVQLPLVLSLFSAVRQAAELGGRFLWIPSIARPDLAIAIAASSLTGLAVATSTQGTAARAAAVISMVFTFWVVSRIAAGVGLYWTAWGAVGLVQSVLVHGGSTKRAV
jgi:YidC/Oxa1 family membrane protein insertase